MWDKFCFPNKLRPFHPIFQDVISLKQKGSLTEGQVEIRLLRNILVLMPGILI